MKVLIVNTSERTGGAAVAANRLMEALNNNGAKAKMLVREKETDNLTVVGLKHVALRQLPFLWERWCIFIRTHFSHKHLFDIDIANIGNDITRLPEFKEADIIHLHWVNQGMLSLQGIRKILKSGKPVVWTLHDIWPATAICHITLDCKKHLNHCENCPLLPAGQWNDLAKKVWKKKSQLYNGKNLIRFVACSQWLTTEAKRSKLFVGQQIITIPNPIDTRLYRPTNRAEARHALQLPQDKRLLFFVAQRVTNANKGIDYLIAACEKLANDHPEMLEDTAIVILGGNGESFAHRFKFPVYALGYVNDAKKIINVYNAVNLYVTPSLSDNLPNTVMEAMACGIPCVGFNIGGIPEMIDHLKNGYLAAYRNADDLAQGIYRVLNGDDYSAMSKEAVKKVVTCYSQRSVALKYIELYSQAIAITRYKL